MRKIGRVKAKAARNWRRQRAVSRRLVSANSARWAAQRARLSPVQQPGWPCPLRPPHACQPRHAPSPPALTQLLLRQGLGVKARRLHGGDEVAGACGVGIVPHLCHPRDERYHRSLHAGQLAQRCLHRARARRARHAAHAQKLDVALHRAQHWRRGRRGGGWVVSGGEGRAATSRPPPNFHTCGCKLRRLHPLPPHTHSPLASNPASSTVDTSSAGVGAATPGRQRTSACRSASDTAAVCTPGSARRAASTADEHAEQCMPFTSSFRMWGSAVEAPRCSWRRLVTTRASKPAASTASTTAPSLATAASNVTSADSLSSATLEDSTPGSTLEGAGGRVGGRVWVGSEQQTSGGVGGVGRERARATCGAASWAPLPRRLGGTHRSAASTAEEQEEQCMPLIDSCMCASVWGWRGSDLVEGEVIG